MTNMTIYITLTSEFKKKAMDAINDTIEMVLERHRATLSDQVKKKIRNLSLDQINVNVTHKNKLKNIWVFDTEDTIPVLLLLDTSGQLPNDDALAYKLKSNGEWEIDLDSNESLNKEEFEAMVLKHLIDDFGTASFYGTLSYMDDNYEK